MATNANSRELFQPAQDNNDGWNIQPYGVALGKDYSTYLDSIKAQLAIVLNDDPDYAGSPESTRLAAAEKMISQDKQDTKGAAAEMTSYHAPSVSDASIGGNDAINPHAAFGLDDDIVHEVFTQDKTNLSWGMGRVYSEIYDSKQQILYLTMGVPKYRNLTTWLKNASNKQMAELNETGTASSWPSLGSLLTSGLKLAIELPWLPIIWAHKIITSVREYPVTEYFRFQDTMSLYYRYVNQLMSEIAVGMGIYGNGSSTSSGTSTSGGKTDGVSGNGANMDPNMRRQYESNTPAILKDGPDILKIMCRRSERMSSNVSVMSTDDMLQQAKNKKGDPDKVKDYGGFLTGFKAGAMEGASFVGFRIERSDQAGENFSNSTQESNLASQLNSMVQENRDMAGENKGEGLASWAQQKISQITHTVKNIKQAVSSLSSGDLTKAISYVAAGNGYFDLPKQWAGSSGMGRTLNFSMKLRSRTGADNVSIYQSIMIPLCLLLAAALPRGAGDSTYVAPFLVRAFCKGMFAIPAGIIQSLSITRGASEFGWSISRLPTVVDVNFTIEDLSPMLFLSLASNGVLSPFMQAFTNNTKMHEYINTLTGIGCKERYFRLNQMKRNLTTAWLISRNTTFSPTYWGFKAGDSTLVRAAMALTPWHRVKNN